MNYLVLMLTLDVELILAMFGILTTWNLSRSPRGRTKPAPLRHHVWQNTGFDYK